MMSALFAIDWSRPWLAHVREVGESLALSPDWRAACNTRMAAMQLRNHRNLPLQCVPQETLPADLMYEKFISDTGNIPTRDNLHDFFNALVWLHFPKIKVQLNALQSAEIARAHACVNSSVSADVPRGKVRDAATIFDENAVLFMTEDGALVDALREHQWQQLFVVRRAAFGAACRPLLFGHALMEKLVVPRKPMTGHTWVVALPAGADHATIDAHVAEQLERGLTTAHFSPLPVLGVPAWSAGQDAAFYEDVSVFRPKRNR